MKSPCQLMILAGCALTIPATHFNVEPDNYRPDEGTHSEVQIQQPPKHTVPVPRLSIGNDVFAPGETPTYSIQGASANTPIYWSSWKDGTSTGEVDVNYGETTDDSGNWTSSKGPWSAADSGIWIKQANINGVNVRVQFQVTAVNNQLRNSPSVGVFEQ